MPKKKGSDEATESDDELSFSSSDVDLITDEEGNKARRKRTES
jgi:hypothetical protein